MASDAPTGGRPRYARDASEFDRAIGFIDATFALALTLLITTLQVPDDTTAWESLGSLDDALATLMGAASVVEESDPDTAIRLYSDAIHVCFG